MELLNQLRNFVPRLINPVIVLHVLQEILFMHKKEWTELGKGRKEGS